MRHIFFSLSLSLYCTAYYTLYQRINTKLRRENLILRRSLSLSPKYVNIQSFKGSRGAGARVRDCISTIVSSIPTQENELLFINIFISLLWSSKTRRIQRDSQKQQNKDFTQRTLLFFLSKQKHLKSGKPLLT